jgi:hypothetical protein
VVVLDEAQEALVLVDDARNRHARVQRTGEQRLRGLRLDDPFGIGDRVSMRIDLGTAEHLVHPIDQAVGHDMFELLGLIVHFVPPVPHDADEEQFDDAMAPDDKRRELFPSLGKRHSRVRLVFEQSRLREPVDHRRGCPGGHAQGCGELSHGQETVG